MRWTLTYPTLVRSAYVAGLFSLVVAVLMVLDFAGRGKLELFDTPEYLALRAELRERPADEETRQTLRALDLHLREQYFRNRRFLAVGMYLLLGGVTLTFVFARWAAAQRPHAYLPGPVDTSRDRERVEQRAAAWAAAGVVGVLAMTLGVVALRIAPIAPPTTLTLASDTIPPAPLPPAGKSDGQPAAAPASATDAAPAAAAPTDAALPGYEVYRTQWPRFRGPTGSGVARFDEIPTTWNGPAGEGIGWKAAVPLPGNNSPLVWERRVLLSGATADEQAVFCFDTETGELVWRHDLPPTRPEAGELEVMEATGYAAPTTATDGVRVYAIFPTGDLVAVSLDGQRAWHKYLGLPKNSYGHASSLATHEDLVIVQLDQATAQAGLSRLLAVRGATGEIAWEVPRPVPASWASPLVVDQDGRWMIITAVNPWIIAYAPADGSELWRAKCLGGEVGPSPVYVDGVVYAANEMGGFAAVRADGTGDVTDTHILWTTDIDVPDIVSPLVTDQFVVLVAHGMLGCFDRAAGGPEADPTVPRDPLWEEDLLAEISSSPSQVGDLVYVFSEEGKAWILRPTREACERVAELELGEAVKASPAFQPGRIYVRGEKHLYCIGKP
ncbi:MAG: PQQ-like beta-propeller repeat protein [Pirellulaceae bacterium]|jgi:outer membrane protein assembly factor BamB|nr:PQQ-like beta-propeller repeat protein [Pirellulaceae bacterium]